MKFVRILVAVLCVVLVQSATAQIDHLGQANASFKDQRYFEAIDAYKKAYARVKKADEKAQIIFQIAESYRLSSDVKQSIVWYDRAIKASYENPIAIYYLAEAKKLMGNYKESIEEYEKYLEKVPGDAKAKKGLKSSKQSLEWMDKPTRFEVVNAPIINSPQNDLAPFFSDKKHNQLIFTSSREGSAGSAIHGRSGQNFPDLYMATRDKKGKWSEPIPLTENVNSPESEGASCMNARKNVLYFTRCPVPKEGVSGCQIYTARKQGLNWSEAEVIEMAGVSDTNTVGHPAISADDKTLVFASDMPGSFGGRDLWYITNLGRGKWSEPVNLGSSINTPDDELFPFIDQEGNLYFASNGHIGMGGFDIFKATDAGNKQWGNVENLKYPINSNAHDLSIVYDKDKPRGYLTSSRDGGVGDFDVWEFYLPALVFAIEGEVKDKENGEVIAGATVVLKGSDGSVYETTTDNNGTFVLAENGADRLIKPNSSYKITVGQEGYLNAKGNETSIGEKDSKVFYHLYELQPVKGPIKLPQINYEFARWELLPESKDSLNYLYDIMIDNPTIVIELAAHTDFIGSQRDNQVLSQKRAQSCVDYLIGRGIVKERMVAKGYGEDRPLPGLTESKIKAMKTKEEQEIARAKNRRTEFSVIREDYVPKGGSGGSNLN